MNALDELLHDAVTRLDHATATMIAPELPDPSRKGARIAVGAVCLIAVGAAGYAVSIRSDEATPAALPPGLREGRYGTEIVMREMPDGDNDPETFSLLANPGGGYVKVTKPTGGTTKVTVADGSQESSAAELCLEAPSGGFCGTAAQLTQTQVITGPRSADGQVIVYGLPESVVAVTLQAGTERHWSEPIHGIAVFPFPETASAAVAVEALDSAGNTVWEQSTSDSWRTQAEIANLSVTHQTAAFMDDGYFGDIPAGATWGPEVVRRHGRTSLTGFTGPFSLQSYVAGPGVGADNNSDWVYAVTVPTDQVTDMRERLATVTGGTFRRFLEPLPGFTVVIWGGGDVSDTEIDRFASTLVQRPPTEAYAGDLNALTAFPGNAPLHSEDGKALSAILTDVVGTVDGHDVVAQGDDIGTVEFHVAGTNGSYADIGGSAGPSLFKLDIGSVLFAGLMPVTPDVTGYTITLDDGTVVEPEIVDVRPLVDGKLMYFADAHEGRTIADIDITTD